MKMKNVVEYKVNKSKYDTEYVCHCAEYSFKFHVEDGNIVEDEIYCYGDAEGLPDIIVDVYNWDIDIFILAPITAIPYSSVEQFIFTLKHAETAMKYIKEFFEDLRKEYMS
uniref:Uncharacterized protein n=1 Tax=Siphoviridae sp. ctrpg19 TaxID=2826481 RepID=A0A8S5MKF8_9CAUD|nr:MAG TPA: hypothetical protein [Siphoviridae sp. ctrpg19]